MNPAVASSADEALGLWHDTFYLTLKISDKAEKKDSGSSAGSNSAPCEHMFPSLWTFFGVLLLGHHMLCIIMYVIQFIGLYFVPLSGLLITSILSHKCNYGHHVMFSMEIHLVQKAGRDPSTWQSFHRRKTKTCSKKWMAEFLMFLITTRRKKSF